jgi:hypothetical protein
MTTGNRQNTTGNRQIRSIETSQEIKETITIINSVSKNITFEEESCLWKERS